MNNESDIKLSLADRDKYLYQIELQLNSKKKLLKDKVKHLEITIEDNPYLGTVQNDYKKFMELIKLEKENQIRLMNYLNTHIENIMVNGKLTEKDLLESKKDQDEIIDEIKKIKENLASI